MLSAWGRETGRPNFLTPMTSIWNYRHAGTAVASQLELPEWAPFACAPAPALPAPPDLRFELHAPAPLPDDLHFHVEGDACYFTTPGVAHYRISSGTRVEITPAPDAGEREIRLFLLGSAWGIANYQRGNFPLHAAVVRVAANSSHGDAEGDDGAGCIAFCGASGAGKSSSVAQLVQRGYELWSDDLSICALDGAPAVWPATRRLKLWRESLDALGRGTDGLERDHFRQEKFHWQIPISRDLSPNAAATATRGLPARMGRTAMRAFAWPRSVARVGRGRDLSWHDSQRYGRGGALLGAVRAHRAHRPDLAAESSARLDAIICRASSGFGILEAVKNPDNPIAADQILARGKTIQFDRLDDEFLGIDAPSGMCYSLNPTGHQVWLSLEQPLSLDALCQQLADFYGAEPELIRADLPELLAGLRREGLIKVSEAA